MSAIVQLHHVYKAYTLGDVTQQVLNDVSLTIDKSEFVAITGPSGNGKSTLLNLITGIDRANQGDIVVCGQRLQQLSEEQLSRWRGIHVGIIFQFFQLLPALSLLQNILLAMAFTNAIPKAQRKARAKELLALVGLAHKAHHLPSQVSGGQQQRAAIARALANNPELLIADEPTGNLDAATADTVFELFTQLHQQGKTIVLVTHNDALAASASRQIVFSTGRLIESHTKMANP
ncbi:ABC transporter ATP-binding protein [Methylocucumis oryzae]|uniref:ABC transporter ATP-binding protein n=1 Tax=Methylocucumis oryzae TaxID=1632867 RepID=A0A0F3IM66_9GAMM|nr:ABC transporter ATP-binding protein [Methylocucumis oryzae]KJV07578.1 ABC transporter ATP-binding protein [Methylocucumis oryzae]